MKHTIIILIAAMTLVLPMSISAKDGDEMSVTDILTQQINAQKNEIKDLRHQIDSLNKVVKGLNVYKFKNEKLANRIKELEGKSGIAEAEREVSRLSAELATLSETDSLHCDKISALEDSLARLNEEIIPLRSFRKPFIMAKCNEIREKMALPYSQIDLPILENYRAELSEFAKDKEVCAFIKEIDDKISEVKTVCSDMDLLNNPFDYNKTLSSIDRLKSLRIQKAKDAYCTMALKELDDLMISMSRYGKGVIYFQDIINEINGYKEKYGYHTETASETKAYIEKINIVLAKYRSVKDPRTGKTGNWDGVEETICRIPWLKERFEKYRAWMTKTPLKKNAEIDRIVEEVMALKPYRGK